MKQVCFVIFAILLVSSITIPSFSISPNQQTEYGVSPLDVICKNNHVLVIRASGDSVACTSINSYQILAARGWVAVNSILQGDTPNHYVVSLKNLINSIYLFEEKIVTISGIIYNNDVMIPLVECSSNGINDSLESEMIPYMPDRNSPYFITNGMWNAVGVRVNISENNNVMSNDMIGEYIAITGVIKSIEFASNYCNPDVLQRSAYLEVLSIQN